MRYVVLYCIVLYSAYSPCVIAIQAALIILTDVKHVALGTTLVILPSTAGLMHLPQPKKSWDIRIVCPYFGPPNNPNHLDTPVKRTYQW